MLAKDIHAQVAIALHEDLNGLSPQDGDITASLIPETQNIVAHLISREQGVFCGRPFADAVFDQIDSRVQLTWHVEEGEHVQKDQILCEFSGSARSILTAERTAMNFIQTLSGVATLTHQYVQRLAPYKTQLLDTRKTIPGLRQAQKYAVHIGGGCNHRMGLYDAFLIKENHIMSCGSIQAAVMQARAQHADKTVEVEVEHLDELQQALDAGADIIMLDNFDTPHILEAVHINQGRASLEVSGNITLERLAKIGETGVDFVSVGALTKHVRALDLSLRVMQTL